MRILFTKSFWELDLIGDWMATFVARVAADGFDGTEMFLPLIADEPRRVLGLHEEYGLIRPVIDIVTEGITPDEHLASFDSAVRKAVEFEPRLINSHTGRDIFPFVENVRLFQHGVAVSEDIGVPIVHETHRFRPTYSAIETKRYLDAVAEMQLTADLSHWMVVHESDLSDQPGNVEAALKRSRHIHARVGFEEGPQVDDPRDDHWSTQVSRHLGLWQRILDYCRADAVEAISITPEFGPPPYAMTLPGSRDPIADIWEINVYMKDLVNRSLA